MAHLADTLETPANPAVTLTGKRAVRPSAKIAAKPAMPSNWTVAGGDIRSQRDRKNAAPSVPPAQIEQFLADVEILANAFNEAARQYKLGVTVSVAALAERVRKGDHAAVIAYFDGSEAGGRIYDNQIETLVRVHLSLLKDPIANHVILGALQSGKTGTAILMLVHALIFYLMTGIPLSPMYLLPNFLGQEAQMAAELDRFLLFYGRLEFRFDRDAFAALPATAGDEWDAMGHPPSLTLAPPTLDPLFAATPDLRTYVSEILQIEGSSPLIIRRSRNLNELKAQIRHMYDHALVPLPVLDEVQYGAGGSATHECLTKRIMREINRVKVDRRKPRYIATSATPFAETGGAKTRVVRQRLPQDYCGIVHFLGEAFPGYEQARPLPVLSLAEASAEEGLEALKHINLRLYAEACAGRLSPTGFCEWARLTDYPYSPAAAGKLAKDYMAFVEGGLRDTILALTQRDGGRAPNGQPRGACIRLRNSNAAASRLLTKLDIESAGVEVVRFYGKLEGRSLKQVLADRRHPDRPYVIVVTARARMADAFPRGVTTFIDFVEATADYNALLQGLAGRAMGAGKTATVILSEENAEDLQDYIASGGALRKRATTHGYNIGETMPDRKIGYFRMKRGQHRMIDAFLDEVQHKIIDGGVSSTGKIPTLDRNKINRIYGRDVFYHVPLLGMIRDYGIDAILAETPSLVMPGFTGQARIASAGDRVRHTDGTFFTYIVDPVHSDFVKIGIRTTGEVGGRGWRGDVFRKGRAPHGVRSLNSDRTRDHLEPSIGLTPEGDGRYTVAYVDMPLAKRARVAGQGTFLVVPDEWHFRADDMTPCERLARAHRHIPAEARKTHTAAQAAR